VANLTKYYKGMIPVFLGALLILVILSNFIILPKYVDGGNYTDIGGGAYDDTSFWISSAERAWRFFQPGIALNTATGLCGAGIGWPYFTEWDLGTYILAVVDAEKIGILSKDGSWGSTDRIERIIGFLESRELAPSGIGYLWYDTNTGKHASSLSNETTNVSDHGQLLIALHALKTSRPEYASRIDQIVLQRERTDLLTTDAAWTTSSGIYSWYVAHGFMLFGFGNYSAVNSSLNVLREVMEGPEIVTYNVSLPLTGLVSEPVLLSVFNLEPEPYMYKLALKTYLAQQNRYYATGNFTGFSEGNTDLFYPSYVFECIVTGDGRTWYTGDLPVPIIYLKVGFGFYSIFQSQYALDLINHVNASFTDFYYGYRDGVDEEGRVVRNMIDRTNGIIIASARYALERSAPPSLSDYPYPFVNSSILNVSIVVGDTNHHPPYNWQAYTIDLTGSLGVAGKLGQLSTSGNLEGKLDTSVCLWNSVSRDVTIAWDSIGPTNVISVGGPPVNMFPYHLEKMSALPYELRWIGDVPYIRSDLSGKSYYFDWGKTDYGVLYTLNDGGRTTLIAWGLTHRGTIAACQVLQYFDSRYVGMLSGRALLLSWTDLNNDTEVDLNDEISVVEAWP